MKRLFLFLLNNIKQFGDLTSAIMYDGTFSQIKFESPNSEFEISIHRKDKAKEEKKND